MLKRSRPGSVTLMAIVVMVVLGIVVITYNWISQSTSRMLHHTYYNEKVLAIFDGLDVISRAVVQRESTLTALLDEDPGEWVDITGDVKGELSSSGILGEAGADGSPNTMADSFLDSLEVTARLKGLKKMAGFNTIRPADEGSATLPTALQKVGSPEVHGRVEILLKLKDNIVLQQGLREDSTTGQYRKVDTFRIPARSISMEYEFKRARTIPPYFRHFSLYVKKAITQKEEPESFQNRGNFNWAQNPLTGKSATGGVLFVKSGDGFFFGPQADFQGATLKGQFENKIGYIYLGGEEKAHLNLMAGDISDQAPYSETFHLYRGATTDFYKVWSTEFSNFIEKSEVQTPGKDAPEGPGEKGWFQRSVNFFGKMVKDVREWLKGALRRALELDNIEQGSKNLADSNALPLYYVVRKDYGYATEWGTKSYQRFGFARGDGEGGTQTIVSSSLHLFGSNGNGPSLGIRNPQQPGQYLQGNFASPTVVLGNVYRRCLSLSGYKQRRKSDPKGQEEPSTDRKFEVQAGPVEFFEGYKDLMDRSQDPTEDKEKRPIWVWDARVRWNMDPNVANKSANGTYLPLSGAALFGRLMPGLAKLWEKSRVQYAKRLFLKSVAPPPETENATKTDQNDGAPQFAVGMSPLFQLLGKKNFWGSGKYEAGDGYLYKGVTPYFEELLRCFSYSVSGLGPVDEAIQKVRDAAQAEGQSGPTGQSEEAMKAALLGAKTRWKALVDDENDIRSRVEVKEIQPSQIKDEKKRKFWEAKGANAPKFFPFSLPDPWDNRPGSAKENFRDYFEKQWVTNWPVKNANTKEDFFKLYFTPLMTNPARVLPYNYSLRFMCTDLREIFSKDVKERKELLMNEFPAEITDGIGYIEKGENDYLDPEKYGENNDMPLNDAVLKEIYKKRKGTKRLEEAYFFMDEYGKGVSAPSDPDTKEAFGGRSFWADGTGGDGDAEGLMTWDEASRRFLVLDPSGDNLLFLNTILGVASSKVELGTEGPITIQGSGAIVVPGEISIVNDLKAKGTVWLVADKITISGEAKIVQAGLIAHKTISLSGAPTDSLYIQGSVVAGGWDKSSFTRSGKRVIDYNPAFKNLNSFITNIEPRVRKYSSGKI